MDKVIKLRQKKSFKSILSLDTPCGNGDHENYFQLDPLEHKIYESDGTLYGKCTKKAVNIREIGSHIPWHTSVNDLFFSDLSNKQFMHIIDKKDEQISIPEINYTKAVNSSYG